ncbi:MAG: hypothetical protein LBE61_10920 [Burkholderiaceae bacterium]|jgi:hypothetical protein|nr:hypothetical protein [Burkholderiaceae bacterium]
MSHNVCLPLVVLLCSASVQADIAVPAGATYQLAGGSVDLACTDLQVSGTAVEGTGGSIAGARNVLITPGGQLDISGGSLQLAQDYANQGTVNSAGGSITRVASVSCPAKGILGVVDPAGQVQPNGATPVPAVQGVALLVLSLLIVCLGGLRFRHRACKALPAFPPVQRRS